MFEPGINEFMPFMLGVAPGRLCRGASIMIIFINNFEGVE